MTPEELDKLEALVKAATPGMWIDMGDTEPYPGCIVSSDDERDRLTVVLRDAEMDDRPEDRACTAALHNAAPALIAAAREVERLRATVDAQTAIIVDLKAERAGLELDVERLRAFVPVWRRLGTALYLYIGGAIIGEIDSRGYGWARSGIGSVVCYSPGPGGPDLPTAAAAVCARLGIASVEVPDAR